ncbi:hypothetical protein SARC_15844 [Sphaeroforma arctica JP610]|uniref:Uncharacterized protein n=1 Tax=Sphaeroforma arctica JP610 TaxID=667725 RepID=A0A0L0F4U7_9EUKA|nr:hypothetical protein SARC_15844 [Sphaeroforma arctica JP610]KNC71616.1 hypothetical protein SARC_15844 [Sphaeroforma arctica JP610]|eukprot:XP_014145518.1 hypothetical protein SARC_15844 [Sphaeroforma arctica JP610]
MAKRVTKFFFLPFAAIIMILSIVIVGLMFAVNVGMSDFCYTPDVTVTSVLPDDNTAFVSYYTNCEGENRFLDELNDKGELLSLLNDFNPLLNLSIGLCPIETHDDINLATNS